MRIRRHYSPAIRDNSLGKSGPYSWIHLYGGGPVPPISGGSFNHLIWDILLGHADDHLLIAPYYQESFQKAQEHPASIAFIEYRKRFRLSERAKQFFIQKPLLDNLDFTDEAFRCIEETDCPNILVWGSMRAIPSLRWRFPDRLIAYAQRFFQHSYDASSYYSYCDIVLTQTFGTARFAFDEQYALQPLVLHVPNGVELNMFYPVDAEDRAKLRRELGVDEDRLVAIFPSKLHPNKGTAYLFHWIRHFRDNEPQVHFLVVGDSTIQNPRGDYRGLLELLDTAENVTWKLNVPRSEMPALYQAADFCLMPGVLREGMSMVAQESLACGVPVVATARGTYPEIVKHEYNGLLCAPEQLYRQGISAIQRLIDDVQLRESLRRNARCYAEKRLSRERCLANFDHFFAGNYLAIDADLSF
jgi:glycosyltransferase involved in cell wall biosynthesis